MPQMTVYARHMVSHRSGSTRLDCLRQGWNGESGGTSPNNRWTMHMFFEPEDFSALDDKVVDSVILRMTTTDWGNSKSYSFWLKKSPFKYSSEASRLTPNDYYPASEIYNIANYVETPQFARNDTKDTVLPLDYLNHVKAGYGLASYRRSTYASPSATEYTREVTEPPRLIITYHDANSPPTAPTTFTASPALRESGAITLSWSGQGDVDGNYSHQEIQYRVKPKNGSYGSWQALKTATGSSTTTTPTLNDGDKIQYRTRSVDALGLTSAWKESNEVTQNSNPTAPTTFTASPSLRESGAITLSWSGQTDEDGNYDHQEIQYRIKPKGGSYGAWQALKTATGNSTTTTPTLADGDTIQYQTRSVDALGATSDWKTSNEVKQNSNPTAPTAFTAGPTLRESGEITLVWSGQTDPDNNISHQEIQYAIRSTAGVWSAWQALKTATGSSTTTTPTLADGERIKYRTRTVDALGAVSEWVESNEVIQNSNPTAAATLTASPAIYESGNVTLVWTGPTDPDNNISHQEIQYRIKPKGGSYGAWQALKTATGSSTTTVPTLEREDAIMYRSRTVDALGAVSDWVESNEVVRNSAPVTPVIIFPGTGSVTYNTQPFMGLDIAAEPNGQSQTLYFKVDNGAAQNAGAASGGTQKLQIPINASGSHTVRFWLVDGLGAASGEASVTITVAASSFARSIMAGTLIWDEAGGHRTSDEILELKNRVNVMRAYYGLSAISLPYESPTGADSIKHFHTWMDNMIALFNAIAETGTVSGANVPARVTRARNAPSAEVINQIRSMLGSL